MNGNSMCSIMELPRCRIYVPLFRDAGKFRTYTYISSTINIDSYLEINTMNVSAFLLLLYCFLWRTEAVVPFYPTR
jgi:hypothetical protein